MKTILNKIIVIITMVTISCIHSRSSVKNDENIKLQKDSIKKVTTESPIVFNGSNIQVKKTDNVLEIIPKKGTAIITCCYSYGDNVYYSTKIPLKNNNEEIQVFLQIRYDYSKILTGVIEIFGFKMRDSEENFQIKVCSGLDCDYIIKPVYDYTPEKDYYFDCPKELKILYD